jgi:hypothetical protein
MKHYFYALGWMIAAAGNALLPPHHWWDYAIAAFCVLLALDEARKSVSA